MGYNQAAMRIAPSLAAEDQNLLQAAKDGDLDTLTSLLDQGADPNARESVAGMTPLMIAAQRGYHCIASYLLRRFPSMYRPSASSDDGQPANEANGQGVRYLEDLAFARSYEGWAPIHYAADAGNLPIILLLFVFAEVDLDDDTDEARDHDVTTPGLLAAANGHLVVADHIAKCRQYSFEDGLEEFFKHGDEDLLQILKDVLGTAPQDWLSTR